MQPPDEIPLSSIVLGERGRSTYSRIEELAQSIEDNGLIQPIVLVPLVQSLGDNPSPTLGNLAAGTTFGLDAGGRRYHAIKLLGITTLFHGMTSVPGRAGYVLKGESYGTPLQRLMTEIAENLDRDDPDWQDQVKMITKATRLLKSEYHAKGEEIIMRDLGVMIGVEYSKLQAATYVHDDLIANPERYKDVTSIRGAYTKLLKTNEAEVNKVLSIKSLIQAPKSVERSSSVSIHSEPEQAGNEVPINIPLTSAFSNCDSLVFMQHLPGPTFDHIVTDPDYGVSVERLNANMANAGAGVHQESVSDSVSQMFHFIDLAWRVIKDQGFLVFFYDLDHHEKFKNRAIAVGFRVQRWPLMWIKTDYRSNADSAHNFCKNFEYAMVCRKPNAVLARAQMSSVYTTASAGVQREMNHPFAKPLDLMKWIYSAIAIKGQSVFDPFMGSGALSIAAAEWGLKPVGVEIDPERYANALMNLQRCYKKMIGENVTFS